MTRPLRQARPALFLAIACALPFLGAGCDKPYLTEDEIRSPFDRYDAARNQHPPRYVYDEFGRRRPNLRARLLPPE